jgi:hypothetical protein
LQIFLRQAAHAAALGVARIETVAGRRSGENGYYTWPRFGFNAALPAPLRPLLPIGLEEARSVLDLMANEKGRRWWREHGLSIPVVFDLAPGSRSRTVLARYAAARTKTEGGPKRNLEKRAAISYVDAR